MIGNLYKVTLTPGLSAEERNEVLDEISKVKGISSRFNKSAEPPGDEFYVHTIGNEVYGELRKIKGVKSVFQMPVA